MSSEESPPPHAKAPPPPDAAADSSSTAPPPELLQAHKLPSWLNHFNASDLKILFRCCVAAWVASLLLIINPSLQSLGTSAFFAVLVVFIVPPAGIFFVYLLASLSLLFGMCLAWAWGLIIMKAAYAVRSDADTQSQLQVLQQQAAQAAGQNATVQTITALVQIEVFNGAMLDTRITVVFYVLSSVFIYAMSRIRGSNPKLQLTQLFGIIVIDVFLLIGPLLPRFNGVLPQVLVKPGAIGIGLGTVCNLLFFPQSTSYAVLRQMETLLRAMEAPLHATEKRFTDEPTPLQQLHAAKGAMIGLYKAMQPNLAFLPLDFSRGRWSADDVKNLHEPVRLAMLASVSLLDFQIAVYAADEKAEKLSQTDLEESNDRSTSDEKDDDGLTRQNSFESTRLLRALTTPEERVTRAKMGVALRDSTAEILELSSKSVKLAADCVNTVNTRRWFGHPSQEVFQESVREMQETLAALKAARISCIANTTEAVLSTHSDLFDEDGKLKDKDALRPHSLHGIVICMVVEERILTTAAAIDALLEAVTELANKRTKHQIWLPNRMQYAMSWIISGNTSIPISGTAATDDDDPDVVNEESKEVRRRLRLIRGYESPRGRTALSRAVVGIYQWLFNPTGMYALRMVIATFATSIPAALPHTAGFFYREKGIWAVISAQTCLLFYMSDFTFSLVARTVGTTLGGLVGLVVWYVGSGSGPGNPYGLAAAMAVATVICMWLRLFLPPSYSTATVMIGATYILIIGFSFDTHHIVQYGLPGIGYEAFWKRLVTVLIGFFAATIVQLFPKPPSATTHISKTLANTVRTLSDHYALLLSHWSRTDQHSPVGAAAEQLTVEVAESLFSLNGPLALLSIDLSVSPLDQATLQKVQEQCQNINQSLGRLLFLSASLSKELQERLVQTVGFLDDRSIGNIMAVMNIIEQSLRNASPLPEKLPNPLVRTCFEAAWFEKHHRAELSTTLVRDENYRRYCVALSSYLKFLKSIDDLVAALKQTLGECHVIHPWEDEVV